MTGILEEAVSLAKDSNLATVFGYYVKEPKHYGVVEFDKTGLVKSIEEKPVSPKSNFAVTGLYFYPNDVISKVALIEPSLRGELEITSLNQLYLNDGRLKVEIMSRGYAWLDTGTHENLLDASTFIETIEKRQGLKVACLEEVALEKCFISAENFKVLAKNSSNNQYGQYLLDIAKNI
jgi:glucose-1-phosphate thymidylyltransferase